LLIYSICSKAQDITTDQLKSQLAAHPQEDTFRVNRINDLTFDSDFSLSERKEFAMKALTLSRKIGYLHGEGIALANVGYYTFRLGDEKRGDSLLQEARAFAKKIDDPELNGVLLYRSGLIILHNNPEKSPIDPWKKAGEAFEKSGNYKHLLECWSQMIIYYQGYVSNYPIAMEYLLKYIQLSEKLNFPSYYIDVLTNLGALYSFIGDHEKWPGGGQS
jgi:tetratricopeptide (TPR) repeat protein